MTRYRLQLEAVPGLKAGFGPCSVKGCSRVATVQMVAMGGRDTGQHCNVCASHVTFARQAGYQPVHDVPTRFTGTTPCEARNCGSQPTAQVTLTHPRSISILGAGVRWLCREHARFERGIG